MLLSNGSMVGVTPQSVDYADSTSTYAHGVYGGNSHVPLVGSWSAYGEIYTRQLWVGVVVRKLAMATARNRFEIKKRDGSGGEKDESGNLAELMARPNDRLSGFELWQWTSSTYDIYGEAFWLKLRDLDGRVRELHPIHPTNVVVKRNDDGDVVFSYRGRADIEWPEDDVVVFKNYNPENLRRGLSNLEGLRMTLLNEDASRRATASWWNRGARPSLVVKHPKTLSDAAINRLSSQIDAQYSGSDNAGRPLVLEEAMEATVVQLSAEEMQYIESRKLNREEVCGAYDVPPPVVHILDQATFSNITEQLRSMYRDTMAPRFEMFESVVDHQLVPDFYKADVFTKFNMDDVLRGDFETRATAVAALIERGVMRPSEARPLFNLPPAGPESEVLYANAALLPLGSTAPRPQQVATDGTLMAQPVEERSVPTVRRRSTTFRSIMGRISRVKANAEDTRDALTEEHRKALGEFFTEQRDAVIAAAASKASGVFNATDWDEPLTELLTTLSTATASAVGAKAASDLGGTYDPATVEAWIATDAKDSARKINRTTSDRIDAAIADMEDEDSLEDAVGRLFDEGTLANRADEVAVSRMATVVGFATLVAGQQVAVEREVRVVKTWNASSSNPRSSHAQMDGETVGIDELFSNGMNAPGDPAGGADEVAGCMCGLTITVE
ncbi:phage portal protein [Microbacterium sp. MYb62]|uniref:phage portal protein n=1 Tax=Microbacterium sp. MYb62 TaxID=1848690 RepID=UPI0011B0E707|nr:phage portal protein [Microbacterium sp. MYb62]